MRCDIKIMAVPNRREWVLDSCKRLGLDEATDVYYGDPSLRNAYITSMGAFSLPHAEGVTHRCVIQDDVEVCDHFVELCDYMAMKYPHDAITFYTNNKKAEELACKGIPRVIRTGEALHGQAIIFPLSWIDAISIWHDAYLGADYPHDDRSYARFCKAHGVRTLTVVPAAVKHLGTESSEMGNRYRFPNRYYRADVFKAGCLVDDTVNTLGIKLIM